MQEILVATFAGLLGIVLLFWGYRFARILIALWGLVSGIALGASVTAAMASTPVLGTTTGVIVGVLLGLLFAVFAYLYYSVAVIVLGIGLGFWLGSGGLALIGLPTGILSVAAGVILGALFGLLVVLLRVPRYLLIAITSFAGATTTVGAALLITNQVPLSFFNYAVIHATVVNSWFWSLMVFVLAAIGVYAQAVSTRNLELEQWGETHPQPPASAHHY